MQVDPLRERRLNPLALPAETNMRFTLLVVAAVMLIVWTSLMLTGFFSGLFDIKVDFLQTEYPSFDDLPGDLSFEQTMVEQRARLLLYLSRELGRITLPILLLLALFVIATIWYRSHPYRIRRQFPSKPLKPDEYPEFGRRVQDIVLRADLEAHPDIEVGESLSLVDGQAYGFEPRYIFRVDGGLRRLMRKAGHVVETVILHELGHIANGDVGRYYFAQAIWLATVVVLFAPAMIGLAVGTVRGIAAGGQWGISLFLMLQLAAGIGLVSAMLAGLLRIREKYADWRAAVWGAEGHLKQLLVGKSAGEKSPLFSKIWRRHPSSQERLDALSDPNDFFRIVWDLPLTLGVVLGLLLGGLVVLTIQLASMGSALGSISSISVALADLQGAFRSGAQLLDLSWIGVNLMLMTPFLLIATILAGTLALQVQREAIADLVEQQGGVAKYLRLVWAALLLTTGLEIGYLILPPPLLSPVVHLLESSTFKPTPYFFLLVQTVVFVWLALAFARFSAMRVYGSHLGASPPTQKRRLLTIVFALIFWGLFLPLQLQRMEIFPQNTGGGGVFSDIANVGLIGGISLLLAATTASWAYSRWIRREDQLRCPSCGEIIGQAVLSAVQCAHCNSEMAAWLFV